MVAESIFNSVIRYGIAVYLHPVVEAEDVKAKTLSTEARKIQTVQNKMLRVIFGLRSQDKVNMERLRTKIGMLKRVGNHTCRRSRRGIDPDT